MRTMGVAAVLALGLVACGGDDEPSRQQLCAAARVRLVQDEGSRAEVERYCDD